MVPFGLIFLLASPFTFSRLSAAPIYEALPIPSKTTFQVLLEVELQSPSPQPCPMPCVMPQTSVPPSSTPTASLSPSSTASPLSSTAASPSSSTAASPSPSTTTSPSPSTTVSPSASLKLSALTTLNPGLPGSTGAGELEYSIVVPSPIAIEPSVIPHETTWSEENEIPKFPPPAVPDAADASGATSAVNLAPIQRQCLPASARVYVKNRKNSISISIADLQVGDYVRVAPDTFSPVLMLTHADSKVVTEMVVINFNFGTSMDTDIGGSLTLSPGHYIPVLNRGLVAARNIVPGDTLMGNIDIDNGIKVSGVGKRRVTGLYNPQTAAGTIMVKLDTGTGTNAVVQVSTYTEAVRPSAAHALLAPLRSMHKFGGGVTFDALSNFFFVSVVVDDAKRIEKSPVKLSYGCRTGIYSRLVPQ